MLPSRIGGERFARTSLKKTRCVVTYRKHARLFSSQFSSLASIQLFFLWLNSFKSGLVCQWKPFCIPVGESFQKAYLEEWVYTGDDSSDQNFQRLCRTQTTKAASPKQDFVLMHLQHLEQPDALTWEPVGPQGLLPSGNKLRHHCLLHNVGAILFTRSSSVPFLNAWSCLYQVKRYCQASKKLSPRAQTSSPRG